MRDRIPHGCDKCVFNARYLYAISGRSISDATREPSFDIIAWILWRRAVWLGKALRGVKGNIVLSTLRWNFTRKMRGDIFYHLPSDLKTSFRVLMQHACNLPGWIEFCDSIKPSPWNLFHENGNRCRRSKRLAALRSKERSRQRDELRKQLLGRKASRWTEPKDVPHDEVHVYTDGVVSKKHG